MERIDFKEYESQRILIFSEERNGFYYQLADETAKEVVIIALKKVCKNNSFANIETGKEFLSIADGKSSGRLGFVEFNNIKKITKI